MVNSATLGRKAMDKSFKFPWFSGEKKRNPDLFVLQLNTSALCSTVPRSNNMKCAVRPLNGSGAGRRVAIVDHDTKATWNHLDASVFPFCDSRSVQDNRIAAARLSGPTQHKASLTCAAIARAPAQGLGRRPHRLAPPGRTYPSRPFPTTTSIPAPKPQKS